MADWVMVVLTLVYVIATIIICIFNHRSAKTSYEQLKEMRRQYTEESRPYITMELIREKRVFYVLRFTNHGKRVATHVRIQIGGDFLESLTEPSFKSILGDQKDRESIIGIGQHYDLFIGSDGFLKSPNKVPFSGYITYKDGEKVYSDDLFIDFNIYATIFSTTSESEDFVKAIRAQTAEIKKLRSVLENQINSSRPSTPT